MPDEVNPNETPETPEAPELTLDAWIAQRDEAERDVIKGLVDKHTLGLKSALDKERDERKGLERSLRDAAAKAEKGSEAEKSLNEMADQLAIRTQQADAYETLHSAGVSNLKAAWTLARADNLFDRKGALDVDALKDSYPELFPSRRVASANGGEGTGGKPPTATDMNARLRQAAGR